MPVRVVTGLAVVAAVVTLLAGVASAHISIDPSTAEQGGFAKLSFRVPNEESNADTVQLDVQLPPDHPIASVAVQPKAGWTYQVMTQKLAEPIQTDDGPVSEIVTQITWQGGAIKPGEFDDFSISVGPLPDVDSLPFKAVQTYSNGDVVRWIDLASPGGPEPEHPAPILTLTKASTTGSSTAPGSDSDSTARALAIIGIVVGVIGLAVAVVALLGRRKPSAS